MRIFSRINAFSSSGRQLKLKENMKMLNVKCVKCELLYSSQTDEKLSKI